MPDPVPGFRWIDRRFSGNGAPSGLPRDATNVMVRMKAGNSRGRIMSFMQVKVTYRAEVTADPFGSFIVHFTDVPGAVALGPDSESALRASAEALRQVLEARLGEGGSLPPPKASTGHDVSVTISVRAAEKSGFSGRSPREDPANPLSPDRN